MQSRELVISLKPTSTLMYASVAERSQSLVEAQYWIEPILRSTKASKHMDQLARFHRVRAPDEALEDLRAKLARHPSVDACYIKPAGSPPVILTQRMVQVQFGGVTAPGLTTDYRTRQGYMAPGPAGIDAAFAWQRTGGRGAGVQIVDCEWAWNFNHEDLQTHCRGAVVGVVAPEAQDVIDHGTAVAGVIVGDDDLKGVTGIAPDALMRTAVFGDSTSGTIQNASDQLSPGDILLLEIHRAGPNASQPPSSQQGYIAVEWWPDDFQAIAHATANGILVIEAAGNGGENLDDSVYNIPVGNFGSGWVNPFAKNAPSCGAIMVGAGNPPAGTHGRALESSGWAEPYYDRARCVFSNYGSRLDCQGWGWEVTSTGYGDLTAASTDRAYTDLFAGTSSASPIIVGALACVQGALKARGLPLLTPAAALDLLRKTGSAQQDAPGRPASQRIGSRPDLRAIFATLGLP